MARQFKMCTSSSSKNTAPGDFRLMTQAYGSGGTSCTSAPAESKLSFEIRLLIGGLSQQMVRTTRPDWWFGKRIRRKRKVNCGLTIWNCSVNCHVGIGTLNDDARRLLERAFRKLQKFEEKTSAAFDGDISCDSYRKTILVEQFLLVSAANPTD